MLVPVPVSSSELAVPPLHDMQYLADTDVLDRARHVATSAAERAAAYDHHAMFPREDFDDIYSCGLSAAPVPREFGGDGVGPTQRDTYTLWMITTTLAGADLSLGRCWEGHANALTLIDALGSPEQKAKWFDAVVNQGDIWVAWSGEPQTRKPGEHGNKLGTSIEAVDGGWVLNGRKAFSTSATGADWAILLVNREAPGGARHSTGAPEHLLMLACDLWDNSITVDDTWWDPIGMRATASHLVTFHDTFIPRERLIGSPGDYLKFGWQTAFTPHYAASFLGAAEAASAYTLDYVAAQGKSGDPYVQHRVGSMSVNIDTAYLWLRHVAGLWESGRPDQARLIGSRARYLIEHLALDTVDHAIRTCGARSMLRPSALERILRDLTFYARHDNNDHVLSAIGRSALGEGNDMSFFKP